ncbi:aldo/keto reductase [Streptomyces sp. NPDC046821]|uniref:aldo/keto reductase n=1 Tax=Streptomyces sp. NPDC046821 TaxID=3154702 RepID=UPI00340190F2
MLSWGPGCARQRQRIGAVGNRNYLRQAAHMSSRRLVLDHIDLYYPHTPAMTDVPLEDIIGTLAEMRRSGLIRHIGMSDVSAEQLRTAMAITPIAAAHRAAPCQIAMAWQLHRGPHVLPIPGTTGVRHLEENLVAGRIRLRSDEVDAIAALVPEAHCRPEFHPRGRPSGTWCALGPVNTTGAFR